MRKVLFSVLISFILFISISIQLEGIAIVKAAPDIHQGDLILDENNVTIVSGEFSINGSIIVADNATLILRDAVLNLTQTAPYMFNLTLHHPINGQPRLLVENSRIETNGYRLDIWLAGNSTATCNNLTTDYLVRFEVYSYATLYVTNSPMGASIYGHHHAVLTGTNSTFNTFGGYDDLVMDLRNCTVDTLVASERAELAATNCSVTGYIVIEPGLDNISIIELKPGFFVYWNYEQNCSVETAFQTLNITLTDVEVSSWSFTLEGTSNTSISASQLHWLSLYGLASANISNSVIALWLDCRGDTFCHAYNTTVDRVRAYDNAKIWFTNSTSNSYHANDQAAIFLSWYLSVHVVDSIGQDVPAANITTTYPNATLADQELSNGTGWASFTLTKMLNTTGEYPDGNYTIQATYDIYAAGTSINMTENRQLTLILEDFIIPEFPPILILPLIIALLVAILWQRKPTIR